MFPFMVYIDVCAGAGKESRLLGPANASLLFGSGD